LSFAREKRLWIGALALLAPFPLPWNEVIGWLPMSAYFLAVLFFLQRALADPPGWMPAWGMNVLGLVYLPYFFFDLLVLNAGRLVTPVLHLLLFALAVKLFALGKERDKWQCTLVVFFLFLAAMGTSVHPTIVLYLLAYLGLSLAMLARFALLHVLASFGRDDPALARVPLKGFLGSTVVLAVVLAVPLFTLLPRVSSPYILGRGVSTGTPMEAAGFSDEVTLDSIGQIRTSRNVALRLLAEGGGLPEDTEVRLKAATYDVYQRGSWRRSLLRGGLPREQRVRFRTAPGEPVRWMQVWLQPLRTQSLPLPIETLLVEPKAPDLVVDEGGAVSFPVVPLEVRNYRVGLGAGPALYGSAPRGTADPSLDLSGVTPRIAELAARTTGGGDAAERAARLEQHLSRDYSYSTRLAGRSGDNAIEDFLFRTRSGHCEYFASSMVLMLRSQGIPARLVTGFLGGEYNPFEGYFIVRQSNAHAWVEAYLPGRGWQLFDPTPPAGRPAVSEEGMGLLARQAWDYVLFRWDRYVLTFGLSDQLQIFGRLRQAWMGLMRLFDSGPGSAAPPQQAKPAGPESAVAAPGEGWSSSPYLIAGGALSLALAGYLLYRHRRMPLSATTAYRRLRHRLDRAGLVLSPAAPPLAVRREADARFPAAAAPAGVVVDFYLRESFGDQPLSEEERGRLAESLREAERTVRLAGRGR
jgi:transglutaminase-like putative cysteine protease